jgi:hypothetical protein
MKFPEASETRNPQKVTAGLKLASIHYLSNKLPFSDNEGEPAAGCQENERLPDI